ncbi:T9SS type A sorting domain-containing protein [Pontibacter sp. H249]|uniref:T9SS type A sorting domain-containing protein n=1 Tax=Pontibacter sp. H249 TaxID=3133420 RepID=UPI0030BCCED8
MSPASDVYDSRSLIVLMPASLWKSNDANAVSSIHIDAGDGMGFRVLAPGQPLTVSYSTDGRKELIYRLNLSNGTILLSHSEIYVTDAAQYTQNTETIPMTASQAFDGQFAQGSIIIAYASQDRKLRNPLIVAEGFDPGHILKPELRFGLSTLEGFLADVRNDGQTVLKNILIDNPQYDIVYVDWKNGTDNIKRNAMLLKDVIREVNNRKAANGSSASNVIIGQSMGGLITRWTLKDMEDNGEVHQTRLFVSYDSPHQGANVPLGYLHLARHVQQLYTKTNAGFIQLFGGITPHRALTLTEAPAARQMLINYVTGSNQIDNTLHAQWQNELRAKGYPQGNGGVPLRKVAVSNGAQCATGQEAIPGGQLLDLNGKGNTRFLTDLAGIAFPWVYSSSAILFNQAPLLLGIVPGRNDIHLDVKVNATANGGGNRVYYGNVSYTKRVLWLVPVTVNITDRSHSAPSGQLPYDAYPGGFYSIPAPSLQAKSAFAKYKVTFSQVRSFNFVPTTSALDIGGGSVGLTQNDFQTKYIGSAPPAPPKGAPFNSFTTAFKDSRVNELHISINEKNGNWVAQEVMGSPEQAPNCTFLCSDVLIAGPSATCGSIIYLSVPSFGAGTSYAWSTGSGLSIVSGSGTNQVGVSAASGSYSTSSVSVVISNAACGSVTVTKAVNAVSRPSNVTSITGPNQDLCYDLTSHTFTITSVAGATSYEWAVDGSIVSRVQPGNTFQLSGRTLGLGSHTLRARAINECGTSSSWYTTEVHVISCGGTCRICEANVAIYPNPTAEMLEIEIGVDNTSEAEILATTSYELKLYNSQQRIVRQKEFKGRKMSLDVRQLPKGIYYLHVTDGRETISKHISIDR